MEYVSVLERQPDLTKKARNLSKENRRAFALRLLLSKNVVLLICSAILLFSSFVVSQGRQSAQAANPGPGIGCNWYTVHRGDTSSAIGWRYNTNYWTLARVNGIGNVNLIFVNQRLCIPYRISS